MTDMNAVIVPKSDQISADDLLTGPITVKVERVAIKSGEDQPVSISLVGQQKVYRPCKMMSRVLVAAWGADSKNYTGRTMTLYRDPEVKWGGLAVGGIRISHMSHLDKSLNMALTVTRGNKKPYRVLPLASSAPTAPAEPTPAASPVDDLRSAARPWFQKFKNAANQDAVNELLADPAWVALSKQLTENDPETLAKIAAYHIKEAK